MKAKPVPHSHLQHLILLIFFLSVHLSQQLQFSQSQTLLKLQQILGYPSTLSSFSSTPDFCNIEPTPYLTLACYEDNLTQLHVAGNNNEFTFTSLPQNFSSETLFTTLSSLSNLKVLSLVSLGLWGPLSETISQISSLEILNISSNYFSGVIPAQLSQMTNLQSVVLDDNKFTGQIPSWIGSLQGLVVLSMKKNWFSGTLPTSMNGLVTLRVLDLSNNQLSGELPYLHNLTNLQVLHLENNTFGPQFPSLSTKLVSLVLRNNSFRLGIPSSHLSSFYQLQKLDLSLNGFVGPFPETLLSLPSINYLDISSNKFTGMLFKNFSCNDDLHFVNLSSNLLKGEVPTCLLKPESKVVLFGRNCLSSETQDQNPSKFCRNEALAVTINIMPHQQKHNRNNSKALLVSSIGVVGVLIVGVVILVVNQVHKKNVVKSKTPLNSMSTLENVVISEEKVKTTTSSLMEHIIRRVPDKDAVKTFTRSVKEHVMNKVNNKLLVRSPTRSIVEHVSSVTTAKLLTDARCISQTMKMGSSLPSYRTFALDELKEATNNFDASSFISEGPHGQIYKGVLSDGMHITIRGMKLKKRHSPQTYMHHVELISKLRQSHLVSALGHSFECNQDDSTVNTIFLIFEFVPNTSLRNRVSGSTRQKISWTQRIAAAIGVVKGIQFLHTGIVPGLYSNNLKITDILLDNNHNVKISSYNLPLYAENKRMVSNGTSIGLKINLQGRIKDADKNDVYDIGVILLEIILGRPIMFHNEVGILKDLLQVSIKTDDIARRSIVDPVVHKECSDESLMTMMEICVRCLSSEPNCRPSVEDIIWNLQFAAQVQNTWKRDSSDHKESPI